MSEPQTMAQYWNSGAGDHWAAFSERYDELLAGYGEALIAAADPRPGERLVDVGCGAGGPTLEIARRVGPVGTVLGVDISSQLVERARRRAAESDVANVTFVQADASVYPFDAGSFDAFVSRFGVMFFEEPERAFANLARALRPGGRAAFVCWQENARNDFMTLPMAALAEHVTVPPPEPGAPSPFSLADAGLVRRLLTAGGLTDVRLEPVELEQRMGADADDAASFVMERETVRRLLADASPQTVAAATESVRAALARRERGDGVYLGGAAWLVTARRR